MTNQFSLRPQWIVNMTGHNGNRILSLLGLHIANILRHYYNTLHRYSWKKQLGNSKSEHKFYPFYWDRKSRDHDFQASRYSSISSIKWNAKGFLKFNTELLKSEEYFGYSKKSKIQIRHPVFCPTLLKTHSASSLHELICQCDEIHSSIIAWT